jgi:hypothetical protein
MTTVACVQCGRMMAQEEAFIHADGLLCPTCHLRQQAVDAQENVARRDVRDADSRLSRRAIRLARTHAIMWATVVIIVSASHAWFFSLMIVVVAQALGLAGRKKWAYWSALALDACAAAAAADWAVVHAGAPGALLMGGIIAFFSLLLLVLVFALREAFTAPPPKDPLAL